MHGAQQHLWMHADCPQKCIWTRIYTYTSTYIHVHIHTYTCIHIYIYTYTFPYTYIYIWIHIHIHTHIHTHIHVHIHIYICIYIYMHMHIYIFISLYIYRICTSCIEREANVYADVHNICLTYTPAHAWCSTTPVNACRPSAKMHMDSCMCTYATVHQLLCHGSCCELILSLARTSCRLSFTACPSAARGGPALLRPPTLLPPSWRPPAGNPLLDAVRFKTPSKSTLDHDAVAAAVLHKHHPIIRVGAGLVQFFYGSRSHLANGARTSSQKCIFTIFVRVSELLGLWLRPTQSQNLSQVLARCEGAALGLSFSTLAHLVGLLGLALGLWNSSFQYVIKSPPTARY